MLVQLLSPLYLLGLSAASKHFVAVLFHTGVTGCKQIIIRVIMIIIIPTTLYYVAKNHSFKQKQLITLLAMNEHGRVNVKISNYSLWLANKGYKLIKKQMKSLD